MRQRGFGYLEIVVAIAIIGAIATAAVGLYSEGKQAGQAAERVQWEKRANDELADANRKLAAALKRNRELEEDFNRELAQASGAYEKGIKDAQLQKDRFIAGVRAGSIVLRDPGRPAGGEGDRRAGPDTAAAATVPDGTSGCRLSPEAGEFLWSEAARANQLAAKLTLAQRVIVAYYEACRTPR